MFRVTKAIRSTFTPLNKQVLLQRAAPPAATSAGILIPQSAQQKENEATVKAVAPETKDWASQVKVGDRVLLREWGGQVVKVDGTEYTLMREDDLLGVFTN
ncbi:10 kDa heat shock protein [Diplonema papillatum]|nr:10 kDa heat shock protein [Diplonema papillatum]